MGTKKDSTGAVHPAEQADFDVVEPDGTHHVEHGFAAATAALSAGALWAREAEGMNWFAAGEAERSTPVVDLNAALRAVIEGGA